MAERCQVCCKATAAARQLMQYIRDDNLHLIFRYSHSGLRRHYGTRQINL